MYAAKIDKEYHLHKFHAVLVSIRRVRVRYTYGVPHPDLLDAPHPSFFFYRWSRRKVFFKQTQGQRGLLGHRRIGGAESVGYLLV